MCQDQNSVILDSVILDSPICKNVLKYAKSGPRGDRGRAGPVFPPGAGFLIICLITYLIFYVSLFILLFYIDFLKYCLVFHVFPILQAIGWIRGLNASVRWIGACLAPWH